MSAVPLEDLIDLAALREAAGGREPSPKTIREALPPGWVLDADGRTARRDLRILARDGWVLALALVSFGTVGLGLFWQTFPRGWAGIGRFVLLVSIVLLAGGLVGPLITRALMRKR